MAHASVEFISFYIGISLAIMESELRLFNRAAMHLNN